VNVERRQFLRLATQGTVALALGGAGTLVAACNPRPLDPAGPHGLRLHPLFTGRIVATTGETVAGTDHVWHTAPDGGACFPMPDGGWSYVSNCEWLPGGAGFVRFDEAGEIVDAGSCLSGTFINCAGGATPWGTWLSCEEYFSGRVWECDPTGSEPASARPAMGRFTHEAAAVDEANRVIYMTEDVDDGALYRFVPVTWGDLSAGVLEILTERDSQLEWRPVPDPSASATPCRHQVPGTKLFHGGEGAAMSKGRLVFTTKGDRRVWLYDPSANALSVMYDANVHDGALTHVDNVATSSKGVVYVAEDPGDLQIVLVREDGSTFPVVQLTGVTDTEITGPAFNPQGNRLYFSSQRNPGVTYEVYGPWNAFTDP
jgi:hypothetical protein